MTNHFRLFIIGLFFLVLFAVSSNSFAYQLFDVLSQEKKELDKFVDKLMGNKIILVGETHNNKEHHFMQLAVIRTLHEAGFPVVIGLEMFRHDSQESLDRWVNGKMTPNDFHRIYYDNWNYPWPLYGMIFEYARENKIPMAGLNIGREITQQVAHKGFQSLTEDQKGKLQGVLCIIDEEYTAFIRSAFGDHAHGNLDFNYFCEAQLVWDNIMAIHALEYLETNPDGVMIILTGNGHAFKPGIPAQIKNRSDLPHAVILPETPVYITPENTTIEDADFLISK